MSNTDYRKLYPPIEPYRTCRLRVSDVHELHVEECGNPNGKPVVILHGGPGAGTSPYLRQQHDPKRYRIILFDQRGAGKSTPHGSLDQNTTWDLVSDIEKLRRHLGIERWQVAGASWGSTLALAYGISHPDHVTEMIVRGVFTLRRLELEWFYQWGAGMIFPEEFARYQAPIPEAERSDMMSAYYRRLMDADPAERLACALAWSRWEGAAVSLLPSLKREHSFDDNHFAEVFARIESHYFHYGGFFAEDGWLLANADRLSGVPGTIIHGRYDIVTPVDTAVELSRAWSGSELLIVPDAGHMGTEPGISDAMVRATDALAGKPP